MQASRCLTALLVLVVLLGLIGCVPSLHGLYGKDDVVFEEKLLGTWAPPRQERERWTFTRLPDDDKAYLLTIRDNQGLAALLEARLVKIQDKLFLDLYPSEMEVPVSGWYRMHHVPAHTFLAVLGPIGEQLPLAVLNPNKLNDMLKDNPQLVAHERPGTDGLVLTAPPAKLQELVIKHHAELFSDPQTFTRSAEAVESATTQPTS